MVVMSCLKGTLTESGSPTIKIEVSGVNSSKTFEALIDTGHDYFVSMPLEDALSLGLILESHATLNYADGSSAGRLIYRSRVTLGSRSRWGETVLEYGEGAVVLVGMDFLREFELCLFLDPIKRSVSLVETEEAHSASLR